MTNTAQCCRSIDPAVSLAETIHWYSHAPAGALPIYLQITLDAIAAPPTLLLLPIEGNRGLACPHLLCSAQARTRPLPREAQARSLRACARVKARARSHSARAASRTHIACHASDHTSSLENVALVDVSQIFKMTAFLLSPRRRSRARGAQLQNRGCHLRTERHGEGQLCTYIVWAAWLAAGRLHGCMHAHGPCNNVNGRPRPRPRLATAVV